MATYDETRTSPGLQFDESWTEHPVGSRHSPRAGRVARQLVELARLTRGFEVADMHDIEIVAFLRTVLRDYPGVAMSSPVDALWQRTDSRRLATVLFAVLDNAMLHGGSPVQVRLSAVAIVITDHGPGFPARVLADGAKPFSPGSRVTGRGVGLGLAIADAQTRLLGGTLRLANTRTAGARVTIDFESRA
jgi:signal transduction histidine kinase